MFWKLFTIGFVLDPRTMRTIRKVNHIRGATISTEPVQFGGNASLAKPPVENFLDLLSIIPQIDEDIPQTDEDTLNFLNKIAGKEGIRSLKDLLEKRESDKNKNFFKSGRDERYGNETNRYDIIFNITQFVYQMNLLRKLESGQVSVIDKIAAIKQYEKDTSDGGYVAQLKSGGLWKDWNIDL